MLAIVDAQSLEPCSQVVPRSVDRSLLVLASRPHVVKPIDDRLPLVVTWLVLLHDLFARETKLGAELRGTKELGEFACKLQSLEWNLARVPVWRGKSAIVLGTFF